MVSCYFCGVVSPRIGSESSANMERRSRFNHVCEVGSYRLALQASCTSVNTVGLGIFFDGKIFNATELASQLDTDSQDASEILLFAYRKWGDKFLQHVEGEFAFVLWDCVTPRVLLGCGAAVNLPLFYTLRNGEFWFSRALRDLLASLDETPRINKNYVARWLAMTSSIGNDSTFFENVYRVVPGSVVIFEQGRITQDVYWQPENTAPLRLRDSREYADGLREVLEQAIRNRMPACSAVGSLLSGGLDSSSVTSLAARILHDDNRRLHAFTAVPAHPVDNPEGRFCDEGPAAALVAARWPNVEHVLVRHGKHSVFSLLDLFGSEQMEPIINPSSYDWFYESCLQARKRQLDTLFTGDSGNISISHGDHLALRSLASEGRFMTLAKLAWEMRSNGCRRWRGIGYEVFGSWMPLEMRRILPGRFGKFHSLFEYSMIRPEFAQRYGFDSMTLERNINFTHSRHLRALFLRRPDVDAVNDAFRRLTGVSKVDPAGDRRVVEYCLSVPVEYYCEKGVSRSLIRNAMTGILPEQVRTERRRGLQSADFAKHFEREREEALAELARMKKVDLVVEALDIEEMERMMQWTDTQVAAHGGVLRYWPKLMRGFSVGRFLRRHEDGTLFSRDHGLHAAIPFTG